jgi:hypothetical protein
VKPAISICMPYWNRQGDWSRARAAYDKLYPDLDLQFSLCDDGSPTPLRDTQDPRERIVTLPTKQHALNPCVPLNRAVRNATNDVIVITNPEMEHRERVLDKMLAALQGPNDYVMTGCRDSVRGEIYAGPERDYTGCLMPPGTHYHFCVMLHRSLFERAGGFDEEYREGHCYDDNDWLWRLWALGDVNFKYVPGTVWHTRHVMQRSLWKPALLKRNEALLRKKWGRELAQCGL